VITFINVFVVGPADQQKVIDLLTQATDEFVSRAPGFLSSALHRSLDGTKVTMLAHWSGVAAYEAMRLDPRPRALFEAALQLARFEPGMYEIVRTFSQDTSKIAG
jgi:quinol monooxygenase YgiN